MTATTPIYGWPYQTRTDAPDGPNLGASLALAVESTVKALDNRVTVVEGLPLPKYASRQILVGSVATVVFSGIPTNLRRLELAYTARGDAAVQAQQLFCRVNADASAVYNYEYLQANNASASATPGAATTSALLGVVTGASASAGVYGSGTAAFVGWDSPHSTGLGFTFIGQGLGSAAANFFVQSGGGIYLAAGPYTSLTLFATSGNLIAGSDFQLTGW